MGVIVIRIDELSAVRPTQEVPGDRLVVRRILVEGVLKRLSAEARVLALELLQKLGQLVVVVLVGIVDHPHESLISRGIAELMPDLFFPRSPPVLAD